MQMEINDTLAIQPSTTLAFVSANGNNSKATKSSKVHLPEKSKVTIPRQNKPLSMLVDPLTRSI